MFCPKCGNQCENVSVCPTCGTALNNQTAAPVNPVAAPVKPANSGFAPVSNESKKALDSVKKMPKKKMILAIVAVVLVVAIIISSVLIAVANKPMTKIASGVEKLLFDTESFEFHFRAGDYASASGGVCWGDDLVSSSFYIKALEDNNEEVSLRAASNKGIFAVVQYPDSDYYPAISGDLPVLYGEVKANRDDLCSYFGMDYDELAEEMEEYYGITPDQIVSWADTIIKKGNINEDVIKEVYNSWLRVAYAEEMEEEVDNIPDYKTLKKVLVNFITKGLNDEAVVVEDSYKEDGVKYYDLKIDTEEVTKCLYEFLKDNKDLKDFLTTDMGKDFMDELDEATEYDGEKVKVTVGIAKGRLAHISSKESGVKVSIDFSNFNKKIDFEAQLAAVKELRDEEDWMELSELDDLSYSF